MSEAFSSLIRRAILESGQSRYAIAVKCGVDQAVLSRFMADKSSLSLETIDKLVVGLDIEAKLRQEVQEVGAMAKQGLSFEDAVRELKNWTKQLLYVIEHDIPEVRAILAEPKKEGTPSRVQEALLVYRSVKKKFSEVEFLVADVARAIRAEDKKRG